jgi:hypothetical protein
VNKLTPLLIVGSCVLLMVGGAGAAWLLRDRTAGVPRADPKRAEYDALVARLGGDEPAVRDELNWLISSASARLEADDRTEVNGLTRECLDPAALLRIGHVQGFIGPAARGAASPYHFVSDDHRARLTALAGESPSPERVLALRRSLAHLGAEFGLVRQPPDWSVKIDGKPPPMPFLDLLEEGHRFLPSTRHPDLRAEPRVPAFGGPDGDLLAHLELYFNGAKARAAFPPEKFSKLYVGGRIPAIPTALAEYKAEIGAGINAEKSILLPGEDPDPEAVQAVNETFGLLDRFFTAVMRFDQ